MSPRGSLEIDNFSKEDFLKQYAKQRSGVLNDGLINLCKQKMLLKTFDLLQKKKTVQGEISSDIKLKLKKISTMYKGKAPDIFNSKKTHETYHVNNFQTFESSNALKNSNFSHKLQEDEVNINSIEQNQESKLKVDSIQERFPEYLKQPSSASQYDVPLESDRIGVSSIKFMNPFWVRDPIPELENQEDITINFYKSSASE